jgi:LemA protein
MNTFVLVSVGLVLLVFGMMFLGLYNRLVSMRNQVERAWSNIDVILRQRFDEIPQLIQVIEQYAGYEAGILKDLTNARTHYGSARSVGDKINASQEMSLALRGILAIGEAYPELKANQSFIQLQTRVSQLESSIADRRESYNEIVANFNARLEQFPDVLAANLLGYKRQSLFEALPAERVAPNLKMNQPKMNHGT